MRRSPKERSPAFDAEALDQLHSMRTLSRRLAHNRSEAEDLVQDTYLHAIRASNRFTPGTNLRATCQELDELILGQPTMPVHPTLLLLVGLVGAGLVGAWLRPAPVLVAGVIGDSYCEHAHRFTTRFNVNERECMLGCVQRGAEFVLVTDTQIYRIRDQQWPELAAFANQRVTMEGRMDGDRMVVTKMSAPDGGSDPAARPAK